MKVLCIIPARYESKRFPGKALIEISGKSLIEWVWANALKVSSFEDVFIATDSKKIILAAEKFSGKIIKTSVSCKSGTDRVAEAARKLNLTEEDIIINIQADEPLISSVSIEELISSLKSESVSISTLVYESYSRDDFLDKNVVKVVIDKNDYAIYFSRSGIPYLREEVFSDFSFLKHLGIYGYKMKSLQEVARFPLSSLEKKEKLEQLRIVENGYKIKVVRSNTDSESVNAREDLEKVGKILQSFA